MSISCLFKANWSLPLIVAQGVLTFASLDLSTRQDHNPRFVKRETRSRMETLFEWLTRQANPAQPHCPVA